MIIIVLTGPSTCVGSRRNQSPVESNAARIGSVFLKATTYIERAEESFYLTTSVTNVNTFNGFCPRVFYFKLSDTNKDKVGMEDFWRGLVRNAGSVSQVATDVSMSMSDRVQMDILKRPYRSMRATKANGGGGCNYFSAPISTDVHNEGRYAVFYAADLTNTAVGNFTRAEVDDELPFVYVAITQMEISDMSAGLDLLLCDEGSDRNYMTFRSKVRCPRELVNRAINIPGRLYVYKTEIANHREPVNLCRWRLTRKSSIYYPDISFEDTLRYLEFNVPPDECKRWLNTKRTGADGSVSYMCSRSHNGPLEAAPFDEASSDADHKTYVTRAETTWPHWCCGLKTSEIYNCEITTGWVQTQNPYKRLTSSFGDIFPFTENTTHFKSETGTLYWPRFDPNVYCRYRLWQKLENVTRIYYPSYDSPADDVIHYSSDRSKTTFNTDLSQYSDVAATLVKEPSLICDSSKEEKISPDTVEYFFSGPNIIVGFVPYDMAAYVASQTWPNQTTSTSVGSRIFAQRPSAAAEDEMHLSVQHAIDQTISDLDMLATTVAMDWCETQKQIQSLFEEQARLNPSGVLTELLKTPIAAQMVGDIFTTRHCFVLGSSKYSFLNHTSYMKMDPEHRRHIDHKRMLRLLGLSEQELNKAPRTFDSDPLHKICFQRPLVLINNTNNNDKNSKDNKSNNDQPVIAFVDSEKRIRTLLDNTVVKCDWSTANEMFYRFDDRFYYFKNYSFVKFFTDDEVRHRNIILGDTEGILDDG